MMNKLFFYEDLSDFVLSPYLPMKSYHWESTPPYRPAVFCKTGVVGDNLYAMLKCYEENPLTAYTKRDDPIYLDSCLEFFVAPVQGRAEYINVECNSKGVFLCEFGDGKYNRRLCADITHISPVVEPFLGEDDKGKFWGVTIQLSAEFVCSLYGLDIKEFTFGDINCNFYKCGDDCAVQHYVAFSPVTALPPGFHNPECFAEFKRSI